MSYRLTILGCGSSGGNPRVGGDWGKCDPSEPEEPAAAGGGAGRTSRQGIRNIGAYRHRTRRSGTVAFGEAESARRRAVHPRSCRSYPRHRRSALALYMMKRRIPVWFDVATRDSLMARFGYCFDGKPENGYPPILKGHLIDPPTPIEVQGPAGVVSAIPIRQIHGDIESIGFRFGDVAYSPDISGIPDSSIPLLEGLDVWVVGRAPVHAAPQSFQPQGGSRVDRAFEAQASDPDAPAGRSRLRRSRPRTSAQRGARIRRDVRRFRLGADRERNRKQLSRAVPHPHLAAPSMS